MTIDVQAIASRVGAQRADLPAARRAADLQRALRDEGAQADVVVETEPRERLLAFVSEDGGRTWQKHHVEPCREEAPVAGPREVDAMHDADDAMIRAIADLLEAKYRADQFRKEVLREVPGDPNVLHDGIDLMFRTWRDSLALSLRAQRGLTRAVRELLPVPPARPAPLVRVSGPVHLRPAPEHKGTWTGRFVIRNDRATTLRARLEARREYIQLQPKAIVLRPSEQAYVNVSVVPPDVDSKPTEIEWVDDREGTPLAPVAIVLLDEGR